MYYTVADFTTADYIQRLEASAARWEEYAHQARGPYKQDQIATGRYLAALFRGIAAHERKRDLACKETTL